MRRLAKRRIAAAVAVLALLAGGTAVALGATGSSHKPHAPHGHGTLAIAAGYLGISRSQLTADLRSGQSLAQVASATPGHSLDGLVAALVAAQRQRLTTRSAKLSERVSELVQKPGKGLAHGRSGRRAIRAVALAYLGLSRKQVAQQLATGKSLAQVADATSGKSANGLIEAVEASVQQRLRSRVESGHLSAAVVSERQKSLFTRVKGVVERVHRAHAHKR